MEHWFDSILPPPGGALEAQLAPPPPPAIPGLADDRPLRGPALRAAISAQRRIEPMRERWPDWWFESGADPEDARRAQVLWGSVIHRCVIDAIEEMLLDHKPRKVGRQGHQMGNITWLNSEDFLICADLAGIDRDYARDIRAQLLKLHRAGDVDAISVIRRALVGRQGGNCVRTDAERRNGAHP